MIRYLLFVMMVVAGVSCKNNPEPSYGQGGGNGLQAENADRQREDTTTSSPAPLSPTHYVDSFMVEADSLMKADIKLPPIYSFEVLSSNAEAVKKFSKLSLACSGNMKVLVNSSMVAKTLEHTINVVSKPNSDLLLLIDKTTSMADDIESVKLGVGQIIDTIRKYKGTRLAVALYGDKNGDGPGWYVFKDFGTDYGAAKEYINSITVKGGGHDWPESVYDAIMKSFDQPFWQSAKKRNIVLIGDAEPLEKPLSDYTINDVIEKARAGNVVMNFYPIIITPEIENARLSPAEMESYQPVKLTTSFYPNPSRGVVSVGFEETGTYYMEIYNVAGVMVVSEEVFGVAWSKDLKDVPDGVYILRIINKEHKFELVKFILQH